MCISGISPRQSNTANPGARSQRNRQSYGRKMTNVNPNQAMLQSGGINYNHPQLLAISGSADSASNQTNRDLEKIIVPTGLP
jgi:hypothetical protein